MLKLSFLKRLPNCKNCIHMTYDKIAHTSPNFKKELFMQCKMFSFYSSQNNVTYYEPTIVCRSNEHMCGIMGKYYVEAPPPAARDKYFSKTTRGTTSP